MSKKLKHSIYLFITLIVLNIVSQGYYNRIDLTTDNRYTLAKVTKDIIANIDKQLIVKVYLEGDFPSEFKRLQIETRQFLEELNAKNSFIKIQFIRPNNQRERLIKVGMIPSQLTVKEDGKLSNAIIFPWAEIVYKKKTNIVSLLPNGTAQSQEDQLETAVENLEFSFSNAIYKLQEEKQKKVAVLSGNEELLDIQLYSFLSEVTKKHRLAKFTLDSVASNSVKSLKDLQQFDLAIIAKPTESFTEKEKLVLDQYIMNGGKTLWMLENVQADTDSLFKDGKMLAYPRDLNLTDFFFPYGLRVNVTLIQDLYAAKIPLATGNIGNKPQFQNLNWFYHPLVSGNQTHAISKNIAPVRLRFANQIDTLQNSLQKTVLLMSSMLTRKTGTPAIIALESIAEEPKEEDYSSGFQIFSLLIEGDFTSMYANRIKPFNIKKFSKKSSHNKMIVISDGDIGRNQLQKGKPFDLAQDKWTGEQFGNKEFLLNAVDYLLDDNGLIELRNKNVQINLLDKERAYQERIFWQFVNIVLPLLVLLTFGFVFQYVRKRTYS
ncbi:gliding motility-associated ABC transporter substrate-binding protein GldG [Flavobacteriaceae bacterium]|nr:gliding motility-associated ABC transporter substrate-binding protein GldG [Flavobacteriaceae bacterium]